MAATSWEESQKNKSRSRWFFWPLIMVLVALVAGIIFYNNRDYIKGFSAPGDSHAPREVFSPGEVPDDRAGNDEKNVPGAGGVPSKAGNGGVAANRDSILIPDIECRTSDRNDLRIRLSIGLYFSDGGRRSDIMARRDIMAVMVQKTLKTIALDDVKIDRIKPLLLREVNTVFETGVINTISIHSIAVEKVANE